MRHDRFALAAAALALAVSLAPRPVAAGEVPARWGGYQVDLVGEGGRVLPTFDHRGRTYVLGTLGERYLLRIRNGTGRRVEVVASVDGRDVVNGQPAALDRRGYVVEPWGEVTIDGYRLSQASVAAFRFSSVPRSYAARKGDARDVGVVGVAVFPERLRPAPRAWAPPPGPYPGSPPGAPRAEDLAGRDRAEARRSAEAPASAPAEAEASGGARASAAPGRPAPRPGLGTEFGEEHESRVEQVAFERAASRPEAVLTLRYDDRQGLLAAGVDVDGDRWARRDEASRRDRATPFRGDYCEPPSGWGVR